MTPIKPVSHAIRSLFICEKCPSLLYLLAFSPDTLRWRPQVCLSLRSTCKVSQKCRRKCHRSIREKGTVTKAKSLFVGSLEISSTKSSHWKMPNKNSKTRGCADTQGEGYSFALTIWVCTSVAPNSPGHCQKWMCGDVMRNGNMAAKARNTVQSPFRALFGA